VLVRQYSQSVELLLQKTTALMVPSGVLFVQLVETANADVSGALLVGANRINCGVPLVSVKAQILGIAVEPSSLIN
jgi:hypothetical protein